MTNRTITGNIYEFGGGSTDGDVVTITQRETFTDGGVVYQKGDTTATADANGDWSKSVPVPSSGSVSHRIKFPSGDLYDYYVGLGDGSSVNITTLITATGSPATGDIYEPALGNPSVSGAILESTAAGVRSWQLRRMNATAAPTTGDDTGDGYTVGSLWLDTTNDKAYICLDATLGAAVWTEITASGGAVDSVFGRTGAVVAAVGDYNAAQVDVTGGVYSGETVESALDQIDSAIGGRQAGSTKLTALDALTWAANSIILLTGTATAAVVTLASHVWTFLQSASAADARAAIGAGDVTGPASSTDHAIARYDLTTGKLLQGSTATVDDNGNLTLGVGDSTVNSRNIYFPNSAGTVMAEMGVSSSALRLYPYSGRATHLGADGSILMYLAATGRVGIAQSTPGGKLEVNQPSATAAIPPLKLQQADVSEEFIRFVGASANGVLTQSIVEAADVVTPTIAGYVKVFVQDDGNQLTDQAYYMPVYTLA